MTSLCLVVTGTIWVRGPILVTVHTGLFMGHDVAYQYNGLQQ